MRKVTKTDDGGKQVVLDPLEGGIIEVRATGVKFDFDGEKIDVKLDKLEGIAFFKPQAPKSGGGFCRVVRGLMPVPPRR